MEIEIKQEMRINTEDGVMRVCVVDITPECAEHILQYNTNNRRIKASRITIYTNDMVNHRWKSNGMPIVIGDDWVLKDGQHRLLSVVKSGVTLHDALVVFIPKDNANNYDLNATRTVGDILKLDSINSKAANCNSVIGAIGFCIRTVIKRQKGLSTMQNNSNMGVTKNQIIDEMNKHTDAVEFAHKWFAGKRGAKIRKAPLIAAVINAYLSGYPAEKLINFCTALNSGITITELDIQVIKLRDYVNNFNSRSPQDEMEMYYRTQNCLHNYEIGNNRKIIGSSSTEYYKYPSAEDNVQCKFED